MITANITNHNTVHNGTFNINIVFDQSVTDFTTPDITFTATSGNGTTGLTFSAITGNGTTYMIIVTVPPDIEGAFTVAIDGQVTASAVSQTVNATPRTFTYDTITHITTTLKQLDYRDNGEIALQLAFSHDVLWFNKTDLRIKRITGDDPSLLDYYITGQGRNYQAVFQPAPNTHGAVLVDITGTVQRTTGVIREIINTAPILVPYSNLKPTPSHISTPFRGADGYWNVLIVFTYPVIKFGIDKIDFGVPVMQPVMYRAMSLHKQPAPVPDYTDGYEIIADTQPSHCIGDWVYLGDTNAVEQGRYFWLRFQSEAAPNINLRI